MTATWEPGDVLPGLRRALHAGPMFKLKDDHECSDNEHCEFWASAIVGSAMRWSPAAVLQKDSA